MTGESQVEEPRTRVFDAIVCDCGHTFGQHPWYDNPRGRGGLCSLCPCRRRQDREVTARRNRELAVAADPAHVHGSTHTAYACPGFVPFQVCDECGTALRQPQEAKDTRGENR